MTFFIPVIVMLHLIVAGCVGPVSLREAVLGYDEVTSQLEREMLLINIARKHRVLPNHFTVTSSIVATFDYRMNAGFTATIQENPGASNSYGLSMGATAAENPTLSIVPVQGEEFTQRILSPMDESKFEFLVFQGAPIDMVLRLMADGIEVQSREGAFERFILNWPTARHEYEEFRRRVMHLGWLNANRKLFVGTLLFEDSVMLPTAPSPGDIMAALDKGYDLESRGEGKGFELRRIVSGRVAITNYDPRTLSHRERQALNARAAVNPKNFVLVDIRPGHPGGDFPIFGAFKLRSLNLILTFVAATMSKVPEFDVEKDPRTGEVGHNPVRVLAVDERDAPPPEALLSASYRGKHYAVENTEWDRQAFTMLYQLFQMTVTDVSKVGIPVTISK